MASLILDQHAAMKLREERPPIVRKPGMSRQGAGELQLGSPARGAMGAV